MFLEPEQFYPTHLQCQEQKLCQFNNIFFAICRVGFLTGEGTGSGSVRVLHPVLGVLSTKNWAVVLWEAV